MKDNKIIYIITLALAALGVFLLIRPGFCQKIDKPKEINPRLEEIASPSAPEKTPEEKVKEEKAKKVEEAVIKIGKIENRLVMISPVPFFWSDNFDEQLEIIQDVERTAEKEP